MKYTWLISMKNALRVYVHPLLLEGILENTLGYPKRILWIAQHQLNESVLFCRVNKPFLGDNSREKTPSQSASLRVAGNLGQCLAHPKCAVHACGRNHVQWAFVCLNVQNP